MQNRILTLLMLVAVVGLAGCASNDTSVGRFKVGKPYTIGGRTYYPEENYIHEETGIASWYGPGFNGKKTANGERFDEDELTAAHRTLQLPSLVRVTNLENGKSIVVRVTDRGPFHGNRVMDVSKKAADLLGFRLNGTAKVKLQVLGPESQALAEAARRGVNTKGAEVAVNNTGTLDDTYAAYFPDANGPRIDNTPQANNVMVASADDFYGNDAQQPRPPYVPASPIENAVASPAPTIYQQAPIPDIQPSAGVINPVVMDAPLPPDLPPQRQMVSSYEPAITRTRAGGARHPGIPVATLEPQDVMPKPAYTGEAQVQYVPVKPTEIYVQAGSYTSQGNAQRAMKEVSHMGPARMVSAKLGGQPYYRVRIGPIESVEKADALVNTLQRQGRQASIIVTEN